MKRKLLFSLLAFFCSVMAFAQGPGTEVEMADTFRSNGKIYVVVVVMLTILGGIVLYLIRLDRRLSKLEKESV